MNRIATAAPFGRVVVAALPSADAFVVQDQSAPALRPARLRAVAVRELRMAVLVDPRVPKDVAVGTLVLHAGVSVDEAHGDPCGPTQSRVREPAFKRPRLDSVKTLGILPGDSNHLLVCCLMRVGVASDGSHSAKIRRGRREWLTRSGVDTALSAGPNDNAVVEDDWIEVVSWQPSAEAADAFAQWLADAGIDRGSLDASDTRVDIGSTTVSDMCRYWVRRAAMEKSRRRLRSGLWTLG
jgi:hypothetical protein